MNLNLLSNDELLKLRSAKIGQTTQNQEAIELPKTTQNQQTIQLPKTTQNQQTIQLPKITQEQLKVWQEQDKPIQSIVLPFSEPLLNMFSGLFGTRTNADDELKNAKTTEQQVSAINNILSKKAASKPIFRDNTSDKEQALKDISDKLYTQNGSRIVQKGNEYFIKDKDGKYTNIDDGILNSIGRIARDNIASVIGTMIGARNGSIIKGAIGAGAGGAIDMKTASNYMGQSTVNPKELAQRMGEEALLSLGGDMAIKALTSKPAINTLKGTAKTALNIADKGLAGVGARHILSQNIGGAGAALKANLGGDHEFRNALESAKDALGADLDNFVRKDIKTINKTSDNRYIQKGIDIANSAINRANETLKGLNVGKADAELLLSALGHENGVKNILDAVANNPQSAQKITEISSNLNKSFAGSINEQLAKFKTQTPKDSFKNSFNQVKKDYADTKDFLVKNSNYQSDFKDLNDNLATILSDTQNINTRGVFNALNGGGNLENLLNAKNAINEQLGYIIKADFKSSSDFINQKALNEAKSLIDNEINTALKNDENLINLYKSANGDYATMKNIVDSNLMSQISRDGKTSLEALNAMIKSNENINGVTLNDFLSSLGAKDRAIAEANIIKGLMEKNSVNGVVDFRALNQNLNSLDFGSEFAKELKSQILNRQALLNNTSDILNALGSKVVKSKSMSQGISTDPLKRAETMKANFIVEKLKPLIPRLGNNEALKLHLNRAILNANGDFKLAIKNIDNIPDGNLPTPTRNLLNEFKKAVKEIEKQVVKADNQPNLANQANSGNIDSLTQQMTYLQNALKGDGFVTYPNSARQETAINQNFNIQEWVKNMSGVISDEWRANLTKLAKKHPEMFRSEADVFRVIKEIKDNPTHFFKNYDDDVALIGKQINDNKFANIGIVKNDGEIIHANKNKIKDLDRLQRRNKEMLTGTPLPATTRANNSMGGDLLQHSNAQTIPNQSIKQAENQANLVKKENERLLKRNSYPVGSPTPTQLTFGKTAEPTANGAKALLGKKDGAIAGTPAPATTRPNNGVEGEIIKNRTNAKTIPNQSIKEAETMAKTAEPTAEPKTAENTQGNSKILTNQDIKEQISKWDLNAPKQTLITNKIDGEELEKLNEHFKFKGNYPLTRQIDSEHIKHALNHHGDEKTEALRGQKAITLDDISNYENYAKTADIKEYSDKKVISKKQINGHFVVVEEALTGKNRLNFVSMWYVKGKIKDVAPVSTPKNDLDRTLSNRYDSSNSTPKEIKSQEPTPQAKADEADINPKSNYKKHERPIELDFKEAIDKGFNVDINALKHFYKNGGGSPLNYMREYMAELDQIEKKALGNEAKDRLKALYENFFYSVKAVERHRPNQIAEYSSIGGQKEFEKIKEFRNEIEKAPTNQKALDALEKIEFVNNLENSPAFKLAKRQKTMKKEFIKEARNALKQATNLALKPLSQFLIKYGKSEEFLTKSSIISKIELENARGLRELKLNIRPIKEFGTNYAEFYHDGENAIKKLLTERQGQVAGAFHKDGLGDIDLVWGEFEVVKGEIKGYGLSKIVEKHLKDFSSFDGDTAQQKMANGIAEIIEKGEIKPRSGQNGVNIEYNGFIIGINKGFNGAGDNKWVVTAFDNSISKSEKKAKTARTDNFTSEVNNLSQNSKPNSTPKEIKSQEPTTQPMMNGFSTMAMEKAILHLGSGGMGGAMNANAEQDPNKKAEAFVKGFLLGAGGSVGAIKMLENSAKLAPQLAQTSQRLAKDLPMILNDRPDIIGKVLGKTPKENYNYIFGGENAIGANKAKLKTAQEMAKNGADESQIWAKTGWYKDIDTKWKFEINPKGAELDISALKKATPNKLGDILKDDELFKAYPQVKDLSILPTQTKDGANAIYHEAFGSRQKAIFFDYDYLQNATNDEIRSTLYHEIQHAIQSIEGFGAGGNTQKLSYEEYKNLAGESEARNVEKRLNRTYSKDDAIDGEFNRLLIKDIDNPKWQELKQKRKELILAGKLDEADKIKKQLDQRQEFLKSQAVKNVERFSSYSPHPFKTLDINPNDRVVKYGSGMSASYTPKQKEVRGVYNVAFNEKRATQIYKDIEDVENVIKFEKGRADNISANKDGFGSLHIQKHLDPKNEGYITTQEYLNMGEYIRKAGDFKESGGKRVYDYTDENGVRFRAIIGDTRGGKDRVISFFSDRKAGSAYDRQNYTRNQPLSENSTTSNIKSQAQKVEQKAKQYAKWLSQADKIPPQAPDELYKAYNKAKRT